jgi:hypothetical protein
MAYLCHALPCHRIKRASLSLLCGHLTAIHLIPAMPNALAFCALFFTPYLLHYFVVACHLLHN